jgi:spermidine/putrescine transport system substrate-binding protein
MITSLSRRAFRDQRIEILLFQQIVLTQYTTGSVSRRVAFATACALVGCGRSKRIPRLNVLNWSNYVAPQTIRNFERESGIRVRYGTYESNEELSARILSGNSGWDVAFPSNPYIGPFRESGLLAPLELDRLTNIRNLDATFRHPVWDLELNYSIPYMWGTTGIVFNQRLGWEPSSWSALWDGRLGGRLTMLDDAADVFGAALKKIGLSLNSIAEKELRMAQTEAIRQKPLVRAYINAEVVDQLISGDVLCAQLWNTSAQQAMFASNDLRFAFPSEGFGIFADTAVILRESSRHELAHTFINYLLRADVAAEIITATRSSTVNAAARALLSADISSNPVLYPSA